MTPAELRSWRDRRGLTREQAAALTALRPGSYARCEQGNNGRGVGAQTAMICQLRAEIEWLAWQDCESPDPTGGDGLSVETLIRRWRKSRTHDTVTIDIPKARRDEIVAALAAFGVRVKP